MTEIEKTEVETEKETKKRVIFPDICTWIDDDESCYRIEVTLPGVEKDTIKPKMHEDRFFVKGETDTIVYVGEYVMCCPVDPDETKAIYKEGLLKIYVPFKDVFVSAKEIEIK